VSLLTSSHPTRESPQQQWGILTLGWCREGLHLDRAVSELELERIVLESFVGGVGEDGAEHVEIAELGAQECVRAEDGGSLVIVDADTAR
jgi:hypothetical protein